MSIRCSVLGHETDEVKEEVESEDGEVSAVRVVEKCSRCGETEVVREKKRVSIAEAESEYSDDLGPQAATKPAPTIADGGQPDDDDAVFIDAEEDSESESTDKSTSTPTSQSSPTSEGDSSTDIDLEDEGYTEIEEDDAVLLDGSSDSDTTSDTRSDSNATPNQSSDQDSDPAALDDTMLTPENSTDSPESDAGADSFNSGAFNGEVPADGGTDTTGEDTGDILTAGEDTVPQPPSTGNGDGETLACDSCRYTVEAEGTPIRRGDICPHCKEGYIESA